MPKPSLKDSILDAGLRVMFRSGYHGASVRDVVGEAGAPQGSFTNHFRSKEAFASAVLERYFDQVRELVAAALDDSSLTPRARLRRYLDIITSRLEADGWSRGCLIGDLSLEASGSSELLREQLGAIFRAWRAPFAACIADGQRAGDIAAEFPPDELAEFLLASWQGAILRMKVERNPSALERFKTIAFQTVFKEPT
jgi:TetR/AcrR family transcriptional regulator, transcriptional repressor for nem operon